MLYERWREISSGQRTELALIDCSKDRHWTFGEMAEAAEKMTLEGRVAFPRGNSSDFLLQILAGWRKGQVICPLEAGQAEPRVQSAPGNCVHLKTTSATSGPPKLIGFTEEQLWADPRNIVSTMGLRAEWPNLAAISLAHSYGFSNLVLPLLLFGIPLILVPAPLPELIRRAAALVPHVTIASVPALWKAWHDAEAVPANVALAISAGAPLPLSLEAAVLRQRGLKIHNFYGSSECGGIAYDRTNEARSDASCAGSPLDNVKLSLNRAGALVVQSDAVGQTYWPEAAPTLGSGRYETSDLAEFRDGLVFLKGRAGDVINVAGRKVSPETIEAALRLHPSVRECVVFGVPDTEDGRFEKIVGCLAFAGEKEISALGRFLSERLPAWQIPRQWWFVDELAANERGKISRGEWRRRFLQKSPQKGNPTDR